ncbi:GPI mannosyltransferase 3-like [Homarus americanus]|uniref:GPI mannosyltransferase 3-like n=1 Tax=Homarus americanus TaxID=6706 RepID=UPI001C46B054|nr:GPI mannosyltransferase 3-like [Homarus americanus]XP_042229037.1 GPI mannosyltransferase 3-like [Homarus americanus]XP_042229038.1 GPI mannosyltransferase 3-like [Homarus americanus]XP_042229039.1 GPI mannosyltransferase 3-like [Homarus americanus]XP_042229040.1 GPI mannosyltransferase 3-like [Homarus americanus]XP_042229041.1 GPI mannosyltransferase 3-like [Homarus americanus]
MTDTPLWLFIIVRLLSVVLVQTWFVADEFWQATEIAHHLVFGYGYQTWEWQEGIRSVLYPAIFASLYKVLALVGLEHQFLLIHVPRVLHALAFAVGDYHIWKLSGILYGKNSTGWITICLVSSWFLEYCAPRTLTSCAEMILLSVALCLYPWRRVKDSHDCGYLLLVGAACAMRPTAAIPFVPLCLQHLWFTRSRMWLLLKYLFTITAVMVLTVGLDSWYYGRFIIVPWKFAYFNVVSGLACHYGVLPWHWYLTQGLPATLTTHLLPFILATLYYPTRHKELLSVCMWSIFVYSCLGHKEFRFLLPVLPLCLCIAGDYIAFTLASYSKRTDHSIRCRSAFVFIFLIVPNLVAALYLGLVHQRGPLDTMTILQKDIERNNNSDILFLMPCHSTPYFSHLHKNISMKFLTCEPNLQHKEDYMDEADVFEENPLSWLHLEYGQTSSSLSEKQIFSYDSGITVSRLNSKEHRQLDGLNSELHQSVFKTLPTHIVLFDVLQNKIADFLAQHRYSLCHEVFHAQIEDGRRSKYILIYCK